MKKSAILFLLFGTLFFILTGCQQTPEKDTTPAATTIDETKTLPSYPIENKEYNLSLPTAETFGKELKDFIYWEYATKIEKDIQDSKSVLATLESMDCLDKELKLNLYYYEVDGSCMDYDKRNFYDVVVTFPEEGEISYFSFTYNAKGLSSDYDYEDDDWFDEDIEDISSQKLEKEEWFQKQYTFFGETNLTLSREEAENYEVTNHFAEGEKEKILSRIEEAIKENYGEWEDAVVCVQDFLPGDTQLSGRVIDLDMTSENTMPLYWIQSMIIYDEKMETFDDIYWATHYSTGYGGSPNYDPTVEQLKTWAEEEKESVDIEKCILAYQIKDGKITDLKK